MKWFRGIPETYGLYLYAEYPGDWDLAQPVTVTRIEYADGGVEFQFVEGHRIIRDNEPGIWYGPLLPGRLERPEIKLLTVYMSDYVSRLDELICEYGADSFEVDEYIVSQWRIEGFAGLAKEHVRQAKTVEKKCPCCGGVKPNQITCRDEFHER